MTPKDGGSTADQSKADAETGEAGPWTIANLLTLFRIALTIPFLYLINQGRFGTALAVFFVASVTDFADGYIARRLKQQSRLGRFLDPLADKLLVTAAFVVLAFPHAKFASIPVWLAIAVVARDVFIAIGSLIVYLLTKFKEFKPSFLGKVTTFAELGTIVWFLVFHTTGRLTSVLPFFYAILAACIAASGIEYIIRGGVILRQHRRSTLSSGIQGKDL